MTGAALTMSREAIDWAFGNAPDVPSQCVAVLVGYAHHADKYGRGAYVSAATLAKYTRKSERQVKYDTSLLVDLKLIRKGDQTLASRLPAGRRPIVYDLAMERAQDGGVQPTAPLEAESGVQSTADVQPAAPVQPTAPQDDPDLQGQDGVQSASPLGFEFQGCNGAQPGVQPTAHKLTTNSSGGEVGDEGGSGGEKPARRGRPRRPKRDLNEGREDVLELCTHLADRVERNIGERPTIGVKWLDAARLMLDNDGRSVDQVRKAIDWCQDDSFWYCRILSMPKLREKYITLREQAWGNKSGNGAGGKPADMRGGARQPLATAEQINNLKAEDIV